MSELHNDELRLRMREMLKSLPSNRQYMLLTFPLQDEPRGFDMAVTFPSVTRDYAVGAMAKSLMTMITSTGCNYNAITGNFDHESEEELKAEIVDFLKELFNE